MRGSRRPSALIVVTIAAIAAIGTSGAARVSAQDAPGPAAPVVPAELASAPETAKLTYWVVLRERANLAAAPRMSQDARGRFVVEQLRSAADRSQAGLRGFLRARGVDYEPFWAANVIRVISDKATLAAVARRPEVERIEIDRIYQIPEPQPGALEAGGGVEHRERPRARSVGQHRHAR